MRFFPRTRHGVLADVDYRLDPDADGFCVIGAGCSESDLDFFVSHVGYAYRIVRSGTLRPDRRAWGFTPHVSFSTGIAFSRLPVEGVASQSPVVGGRVAFDIDFYLGRFFFEWSLGYEGLYHVRGSLRVSHFLSWNALPILRFGVVLGDWDAAKGERYRSRKRH